MNYIMTMYVCCINLCMDPFRRYHDYMLEFVELSLDVDLANSALRVHIPGGCGPVVPKVDVVECASAVVVMFATVTSVFRLILPHPNTIARVRHRSISLENLWKGMVVRGRGGLEWNFEKRIDTPHLQSDG